MTSSGSTHHVFQDIFELPHATCMIVPYALDGLEKPIALHCPLDSFGSAAHSACTHRSAATWKCRDDDLLCELVEIFGCQLFDAVVKLISIYNDSALLLGKLSSLRLKRTML